MVETDARKYRAFISYSHADTGWAKWLHRSLEGFRIDKDLQGRETPTGKIPGNLRPIFRDRDDFTAGHTLTEQTLAALDDSHALIAICSPAAAKSQYVTEEIRLFKSRHPDRPVIPLIVSGKPGDPERECFPPSLRFTLDDDGNITGEGLEVLAADAREEGDGKNLALAKVVAGLLAVSSDDVFRRAERERRRQGRIRNGIAGAIVALILVGSFFGWQAQQSQQRLSEIEAIVAQYSFVGTAEAAVPGAKQSLTDAITSIAEGAARDPRYAKALELLEGGQASEEAEPLLAAVAEDKKKAGSSAKQGGGGSLPKPRGHRGDLGDAKGTSLLRRGGRTRPRERRRHVLPRLVPAPGGIARRCGNSLSACPWQRRTGKRDMALLVSHWNRRYRSGPR
ncbi:MAG: toll/interleukin-1 receptor domain-containing protein [Hyphomicrobiales bacterium]